MIEATATIDLAALQHNFSRVRALAPHSKIIAMVKSNAYGHGLLPIAKALTAADAFGVARLAAGVQLREAGIAQAIVLMSGFLNAEQLVTASQHHLQVVVHHEYQVELLSQAKLAKPLDIWLKIDTGMGRLGFTTTAVGAQYQRLKNSKNVRQIRFMTHFASVDEIAHPINALQFARLAAAKAIFSGEWSASKSAAIMGFTEMHNEWIRPGIMLYGVSPLNGQSSAALDLRPVMTLTAPVISVRTLAKDESVGYGSTWICPAAMPVGVVGIGYGDGYPRHAAPGTPVLINGKLAPRIGRVCMDMIMLDLRGHVGVKPGDTATLWGAGLPAEMIAKSAETIPYELFCSVTRRVKFTYSDAA